MIKITVAIPVYNAAKHLPVTLDSLKRQTMNASEFEVICVNDRSTDNSSEVIEAYRREMPNLVLINRTENSGGPVVPRNDAIAAARGVYIHFLDNDDFLGEEALERLYHAAVENGSDVIYGKHIGVGGRKPPNIMFKNGNRPKADIIADNLAHSLTPHKMFRLLFLKEQGFLFDTNATAGNDDQLFTMQCFVMANVITVQADYSYYFVVGRGDENLSSNFVPAEKWLYVWHRIMEFLNEKVQDEAYRKRLKIALLNRMLIRTRFRIFLLTSKTTYAQKAEWLQAAKRFFDTHVGDQLARSLNPRHQPFWEAVKENSMEKLARLSSNAESLWQEHTKQIVLKRAGTVSYKRPSVNAIQGTTYPKGGQVLTAYSAIAGWFEIREVDENGAVQSAFIQHTDARYTVNYVVKEMVKRMKQYLEKNIPQPKVPGADEKAGRHTNNPLGGSLKLS